MSTNNIVLVDNETSLNILNTFLSSLGEDKNVSVDTEFTRTKTYYPILDLVQICIDDTVYIVDPHALCFFRAVERMLCHRVEIFNMTISST